MNVTKLPNSCPVCRANLDAHSHQDGLEPRIGDLSLCIYCTTILQFDAEMKLGIAPQIEIDNNLALIHQMLGHHRDYVDNSDNGR